MTPEQLRQLVRDVLSLRGQKKRKRISAVSFPFVALNGVAVATKQRVPGRQLRMIADHVALEVDDLVLTTASVPSITDEEAWEDFNPDELLAEPQTYEGSLGRLLRALNHVQDYYDGEEAIRSAEGSWLLIVFPRDIVDKEHIDRWLAFSLGYRTRMTV